MSKKLIALILAITMLTTPFAMAYGGPANNMFEPSAPLNLPNNHGPSTLPDNWWLYQNFLEIRYPTMTKQTYKEIEAEVDEAKARGVGGISLYCAYHGQDTSYQVWYDDELGTGAANQTNDPGWFGCNPKDWFNPAPYNGTVQDLKDLADKLHANGMATGTYITHIFTHKDSVPYKKAIDNSDPEQALYRKLFAWTTTGAIIPHYNWGRPNLSYVTGTATMNPVVNFTNPETITYIKNVQAYFARDIGVDYIEYDASQHYYAYPATVTSTTQNPTSGGRNYRISDALYKEIAFDVPNSYRPVLTHDEGERVGAGGGKSRAQARFDYGYTNSKVDEDIIQGIFAGTKTANDLETMLVRDRDYGAARGGVVGHFIENWNEADWGVNGGLHKYSDEQIALLYAAWAGVGIQVKYTYDIVKDAEATALMHMYSMYSPELKAMLKDIMVGMNTNSSQNPGGGRVRIPIDTNPAKQYAVQRTSMDGTNVAMNVFNFDNQPVNLTLDVSATNIVRDVDLVDIITGNTYAAITSDQYTITLPAYGFAMLQANTAAPSITSANNTSVVSGTGGTFNVTATGTPATFTWSLSGAPAGVSIDSATGVMTIARTVAAGSYNFTINADNTIAPAATQAFTLTVTQSFSSKTLVGPGGITLTGNFTDGTSLTGVKNQLHDKGTCAACDTIRRKNDAGDFVVMYDLTLTGGQSDGSDMQISFPLDTTKYKTSPVTLYHCANGTLETHPCTVRDGRATATIRSLSPFALEAEPRTAPTSTPQTGDGFPTEILITIMVLMLLAVGVLTYQKKRRSA